VLVGLVALLFAHMADRAVAQFETWTDQVAWLPLVLTPAVFVTTTWITMRHIPDGRGSGIPQVIASTRDPGRALESLISVKVAGLKLALTVFALLAGASVGREGPTVQIGAALMARLHRLLRVPIRAGVVIAGGAAGVAAAFNTPLAGVAFAIEELANSFEQKVALLVMTAVLIAGIVSLGIAGDYVYFGVMGQTLAIDRVLVIAPVAGVTGGLAGGLFSRLLLGFTRRRAALFGALGANGLAWAFVCGLVVAIVGVATGLTWGTGYGTARAIIEGAETSFWFGPAKLLATLATALAGIPGGIFSPSLATGAGFGRLLQVLFPNDPSGAVVLLGMVAYFTGVVRAPLTAVIIIVEATASRGLILPLFSAALIAEGTARLICRERLYHGLAKQFGVR